MNDTKNVAGTVLVPAHNEEKSIGTTVRRVKELHSDFEVLVVDEGSTDNTMRMAMDAGAHVWPHPYTIGNGAAIKSGLSVAREEWVVTSVWSHIRHLNERSSSVRKTGWPSLPPRMTW